MCTSERCVTITSLRYKWVLVSSNEQGADTLAYAEAEAVADKKHPPTEGWKRAGSEEIIVGMSFEPMVLQPRKPSGVPPTAKIEDRGGKGDDDDNEYDNDNDKQYEHDEKDRKRGNSWWEEPSAKRTAWGDDQSSGWWGSSWGGGSWGGSSSATWTPPPPPVPRARADGGHQAADAGAGPGQPKHKGDEALERERRRGGWFNKCQALVDLVLSERWEDARELAEVHDAKNDRQT